jgi:hypothetical protein
MKRIGIALVAVGLLALAGCSAEAPEAETETPSAAPAAVPLSKRDVGPESIGADGHVLKQVGDVARLSDASDVPVASFSVTAVKADPTCTQAKSEEPANGHFVLVSLEIETSAALAGPLDFTAASWSTTDAAGAPVPVVGTSATCMGAASILPSAVNPGETRRGDVVLDVADPSAPLTLELAGVAWDWSA